MFSEQCNEEILNQRMQFGGPCLGVQNAVHVLTVRFFGAMEVVLNRDYCRGAHEVYVHCNAIEMPQEIVVRKGRKGQSLHAK